jgi:hypothetical protein
MLNVWSRPGLNTDFGVINRCAAHFGITPEEIRSPRRLKRFVIPRATAQYVLRTAYGMSLKKVAACFNCNHASVRHNAITIGGFVELFSKKGITQGMHRTLEFISNEKPPWR